MSQAQVATARTRQAQSPVRAVVAGGIGNVLEQYDNLIYAYSAALLGQLFFSTGDAISNLLATFGVFAVGFLMRPLGALFFGNLGDRFGRRRALVLSVTLMAVCTTAIGVLPTYASIGVWATLLLVVLRLLQGFSVGGEWAGSTAFIVEYAPEAKRGLYGSFQQVSTAVGFLLAAGVSAAMSSGFSEDERLAWAWRVPFLLAAITGAIALWLRVGIEETPRFEEAAAEQELVANPLRQSMRTQFANIARGFGFTLLWTVAYFLFLTFVPTYLTQYNHVDAGVANRSATFGIALFAVLIPVAGALSDRFGRRPLLLTSTIGFVLLSWPVMALMGQGSTAAIYGGWVVLAALLALFSGPGPAALAEMFPTGVRYSALSIGYNISVAAFGGTAPLLAVWLIKVSDVTTSPAFIAIGAALITTFVVASMSETFRGALR
ncbi:MAG TPA: MFS transporter [Nocardioidaceae bacterium]|nr:MFS transporter [Nocardioidaceae bacterium]